MFRFIKQALQTFKEGFQDGRNSWDLIMQYPQEQRRKRIMEHSSDPLWTDEDVFREFLRYVSKYDRPRRLVRTRRLMEVLFENRPNLRDPEVRRRIYRK